MLKLLNHKFFTGYNNREWLILKISVCYFWVNIVRKVFLHPEKVLFPSGICSWFNFSFLLGAHTVHIFTLAAIVLSVFYIAEKRMVLTTLLMFLLSLLLFTLEESNGVLNRSCLYSMVFLAQALAYYRNNEHLSTERMQFPIQIVAAGYMLAGISKLNESGIGWPAQAPYSALQIMKGYCNFYFNSGDPAQLQKGIELSQLILQHALLTKVLLACSLVLEVFAFLAVKNKRRAFIYGLLLTCMHIGIYYFMHILIVAIFFPMLLFMVNPVYLAYLGGSTLKQKVFKR